MSGRTHIGPDTTLRGNISGDGELTVEGQVDGNVSLSGDLTVANSGVVDGDVTAAKLALEAGKISGKVKVREATLGSAAHLSGSIDSPTVSIHPRARVDARFEMPLSLPRQVGSGRR